MKHPHRFIVGTLKGVGASDARAFVQGLAGRQCDSLQATWTRLKKHEKDGYAYEIQEGMGVSLLDAVLDRVLDTGAAAVRLGDGQWAEVREEEGDLFTILFDEPSEDATEVPLPEDNRAPDMKGYYSDGSKIAAIGISAAALGFIALAGSLTVYITTLSLPETPRPALAYELPIEALQSHQDALEEGEYIQAFRFAKGRYTVETAGGRTPPARPEADAGNGRGALR